jgi:hypothetical protein
MILSHAKSEDVLFGVFIVSVNPCVYTVHICECEWIQMEITGTPALTTTRFVVVEGCGYERHVGCSMQISSDLPDIHLACAASPDFLLIFLKLPQKGPRKGHVWNMSTSQFMNKHVSTICLRHYFNFY